MIQNCGTIQATTAVGLLLWVTSIAAQEKASTQKNETSKHIADAIKKVNEANMEALNEERLEDAMATIHSKSPGFSEAKRLSKRMIEMYDVQYKILLFRYVGQDGEYAIARVKQQTTKLKGPAFQNNVIDALSIFRKESGKWKLWTTSILEVKFLDDNRIKEKPRAKTAADKTDG